MEFFKLISNTLKYASKIPPLIVLVATVLIYHCILDLSYWISSAITFDFENILIQKLLFDSKGFFDVLKILIQYHSEYFDSDYILDNYLVDILLVPIFIILFAIYKQKISDFMEIRFAKKKIPERLLIKFFYFPNKSAILISLVILVAAMLDLFNVVTSDINHSINGRIKKNLNKIFKERNRSLIDSETDEGELICFLEIKRIDDLVYITRFDLIVHILFGSEKTKEQVDTIKERVKFNSNVSIELLNAEVSLADYVKGSSKKMFSKKEVLNLISKKNIYSDISKKNKKQIYENKSSNWVKINRFNSLTYLHQVEASRVDKKRYSKILLGRALYQCGTSKEKKQVYNKFIEESFSRMMKSR